MPIINITVTIPDDEWEWELHGDPTAEDPDEKWESTPENVLADAIDYMSGWRLPDGFEYAGWVS